MGARGPRPTPTAILQARGSWRGELNKEEPVPLPGIPICPAWLNADAKQAWDVLIPQLTSMRILSLIDTNALARYCQLWSRWIKAEQFLQKYGDTYPLKGEDGTVKCIMPFPQVAIAQKLSLALTKLEQEFGMTPSARSRIQVQGRVIPVNEEQARAREEMMAFFRGGGPKPPRTAPAP